jgi:hypothetical protein
MGKYSKEDYEFEKNKQEILKLTGVKTKQNDHHAVWEYEIEEHRKKQKKERFMMFGATLGILSFLISIFLLINEFFNMIG